nr:MAG TPA: hypothetical protein [Bacteriophage sp.]
MSNLSIDLYGKQYYNRITAREHDRKARGEGRPGEQIPRVSEAM